MKKGLTTLIVLANAALPLQVLALVPRCSVSAHRLHPSLRCRQQPQHRIIASLTDLDSKDEAAPASLSPFPVVRQHDDDVVSSTPDLLCVQKSFKHVPSNTRMKANLLVLLAAALYGTNFPAVKMIDQVVPLEWSAAARFGIAALAGLVCAPTSLTSNRISTFDGMLVGFWYSLGYLAQAYGLETVSATKSGFFNSLAVVVVPMLDLLISRTKLDWRKGSSVVLAFVGICILELGSATTEFSISSGDIFCLGQAAFFGVGYFVLGDVSAKEHSSPESVAAGQLLAIAIATLLFALFKSGGHIESLEQLKGWCFSVDPMILGGIVWTGLISTAATIYFETVASQSISAATLTTLLTTTPIWGSVFSYLAMGEVPTGMGALGGVFILTGCLLSSSTTMKVAGESLDIGTSTYIYNATAAKA